MERIVEKIVEYKCVHGATPEILTKQVNDLIEQGFQPSGGVSFIGGQCLQALVKYERVKEELKKIPLNS
jgi:hypothetical protein